MVLLNKYFFVNILMLFLLLPALRLSPEFRMISILNVLIFYVFIIYKELILLKGFDKLFVLVMFFILFTGIFGEIFEDGFIVQNIQLYIFIICIHISWYIVIELPNNITFLIITILVLNSITTFLTIREIQIIPETARLLSNSNEISNEIVSRGIGGYGLVYSNVLFFPVLIIFARLLFLEKISIKFNLVLRILVLFNLVLVSILIIKAGYSIAILLFVIQILFLTIFKHFSKYFFIHLVIIAGIIGVLLIFLIEYQNEVKVIAEGTFYEQKINDILNSMYNKSTEGTVGGRGARYLISLESIVESFLFGKFYSTSISIGGHSTILDLTGRFGIILGSLFVYIILFVPLHLMKYFNRFKDEITMLGFSLITILLFNRESMAFGVSFIFLSCIYSIFKPNLLTK